MINTVQRLKQIPNHIWHHTTCPPELRATCTLCNVCSSALISHTRIKNALPWPEVKTAANMHHSCRYCIINNTAFAKENMNETFEANKN